MMKNTKEFIKFRDMMWSGDCEFTEIELQYLYSFLVRYNLLSLFTDLVNDYVNPYCLTLENAIENAIIEYEECCNDTDTEPDDIYNKLYHYCDEWERFYERNKLDKINE